MDLNKLSPENKLAAGRLMACIKFPYFRAAIMSLIPHKAPGLGTFGVTERSVFLWDPAAVERWSVEEISAVIAHEVGHVLRNHAKRGRAVGVDPHAKHEDVEGLAEAAWRARLWNQSGDREINDDLKQAGCALPDGPCMPSDIGMPDGQLAEAYFDKVQQLRPPPSCGGQERGKGKGGGKDKQQGGGGEQGKQPGPGWCGSGAGRALPGEPTEKEEPGRTEVDVERVRAETARAIRDHVERSRGSVPAGWAVWAEQQLKPPRIPWRTKLARACRSAVAQLAGAQDYRYSRPARRQAAVGFGDGRPIFPIMRAPKPNVAVAVDTSGSMGRDDLADALSECNGVLKAIGTAVQFVSCDAAVHGRGQARTWQDMVRLLKGGGGTDFNPVFEAVAQMRPQPDVLVFATDGCGPAPAAPPKGLRVIWLLVGAGRQRPMFAGAPFGEFVEVEREDTNGR